MELSDLIRALSEPGAYSVRDGEVIVLQTHISVVFLVGPFAYKIKKPVNLGFLDFSTLDKRRQACEQEVILNRRLAPSVYHGVVPVVRVGNTVRMDGQGDVLEWAVKMTRLPDEATLLAALSRNTVEPELIEVLARRIAYFHACASTSEHIASFGRFDVVVRNARENFEQATPCIGTTVRRPVFDRLRELTESDLDRLRNLIESRALRGLPRDTHGDLHLDHVYHLPERAPPDDLLIIDCIEFNEQFRYADPVADVAFLVMDLLFHGRRDLADLFSTAYFHATGDDEGQALLPFYTAYRAVVRAKVEGFELAEAEIPETEKSAALVRSRAHWLLGLGVLEEPRRRPCLLVVGGLPGTGKSTLARGLAERAGFEVIRSDVVRKQLADLRSDEPVRSGFDDGIYAPAWTERTYVECLRRAEDLLLEGKRVVVDANFGRERQRREFLELANRLAVPTVFLLCEGDEATVRRRIDARRDDASDANWAIYQKLAARWEEPNLAIRRRLRIIRCGDDPQDAVGAALTVLRELELLD